MTSIITLQVFLKDTDERACAYIAGPAPNRWGFSCLGEDLFESLRDVSAHDGTHTCIILRLKLGLQLSKIKIKIRPAHFVPSAR